MIPLKHTPSLFPYPTLFRSDRAVNTSADDSRFDFEATGQGAMNRAAVGNIKQSRAVSVAQGTVQPDIATHVVDAILFLVTDRDVHIVERKRLAPGVKLQGERRAAC